MTEPRESTMTREPETEAGRTLAHLGCCTSIEEVAAIETESWNAALEAVKEAVGPEPSAESDFEAGVWDEWTRVLSRLAALRKGASE
jgi:hypothetical protein